MTHDKAPRRAWVSLVLSAVVATLTIVVTSGFLTEYGTTSGSAWVGARDGLTGAAVPLLVVLALAVAAFRSGRGSSSGSPTTGPSRAWSPSRSGLLNPSRSRRTDDGRTAVDEVAL